MAEIRNGKRVDPAKMDRSRMSVATLRPAESAEVEGQRRASQDLMRCPCEGCVVYVEGSDTHSKWFTCGGCGCAFMA